MFKSNLVAFFLAIAINTFGQKQEQPTTSFTVSGDVKAMLTISVDDLKKMESSR